MKPTLGKNTLSTPEYFWSLLTKDKNGCFLWNGSKSYTGYGRIRYQGTVYAVHRLAYLLHFGDFDRKLQVCHKCDVRNCANPEHLFVATHQKNIKDRQSKNRQAKGKQIATTKLTPSKVRKIRKLRQDGMFYKDIGKLFNMSGPGIEAVCKFKTWKYVV